MRAAIARFAPRLRVGLVLKWFFLLTPNSSLLIFMDKHEVAAILDEIATILELQGENRFRALAYAKAARAISQLETNLADIVAAGQLEQIPGVGETLRDKITTLVTTGSLPFYE